jgi:hypothetical protein
MRSSHVSRQTTVINARKSETCVAAVQTIKFRNEAEFIKLQRQMTLCMYVFSLVEVVNERKNIWKCMTTH